MKENHTQALDLARDGKWDEAHRIVQQFSDQYSCLIHAYLHRVEGDLENARYWYNRSKHEMPKGSLAEELEALYRLIAD